MSAPAMLRAWGFFDDQGRHDTKAFQRAFAWTRRDGPWDLNITGRLDKPTRRAIQHVADNKGRLSRHVRISEVRSKGDGSLRIHRAILRRYEFLCNRAYGGRKIPILSGYRDPVHNRKVGGARNSQHVLGRALDIGDVVPYEIVRRLLPGGIGWNRSSGNVAHIDLGETRSWVYER